MIDLSERAMLCGLQIKGWTGRATDKRVSDEVADRYGAERDMGRFSKRLVATEALAQIRTFAGAARQNHYRQTLPWLDEGKRILPSRMFFAYMESQESLRLNWEREVKVFVDAYPEFIRDAELRLGGLYVPTDYPDPAEIKWRFSFEHIIEPLPTGRDFRATLGEAEEARVRADIEKRLEEAHDVAMRSLWQRCYEVAERMAERLRLYHVDEEGKIVHPFRDTLVDNVRELVDILPSLNLSESPELTELTRELDRRLGSIDAQMLRDDPGLRAGVATSAAEIAKRISDYL